MNAVSVSSLARRPVFWVALLAASALCMFAVLHWFGDAFSVLDLDVTMSRDAAIAAAWRLDGEHEFGEGKMTRAAAAFSGDDAVQTFIELEGGGKPALKPFLGVDEYALHTWNVRLFAPGVDREVQVAFRPDGTPNGFYVKVPEADPGPALDEAAARAVATATATRDWGVNFERYRPLTASATTQPGKRVDHEFVYERVGDAPPLGEGRLRLQLVVSGDRLTTLVRSVFVPEAFTRRYRTMRSLNDNIASAATIAAGLLYGLGGAVFGLIWLMRRRGVQWRPSTRWAAVVATAITAATLTELPGTWMQYDTATSATTHLVAGIGGALAAGVVTWLALAVVFAAAEGLDRAAFAHHPQLWRSWRLPSANARAIWGRTLAGYAWIGFDLAFIAVFYFLVQRYLGWWSPSDALVDPNILGHPLPWVGPVSRALQAGMMEEALFRAVPLAGAALIGRRFGREKLFIAIALVAQAMIFGGAHANYPGQPAYARPVELFLPALVWGVVYLRYGLLPGMLFHFGFDLVLMSIPLFVTDAPGIVLDRMAVIGVLAVPLVVLTVQRWRAGRLIDLPDGERNAAAGQRALAGADAPGERPVDGPVPDGRDDAFARVPVVPLTRSRVVVLVACALAGAAALTAAQTRSYDAPGLVLTRDQALAIAEHAVEARGVTLDARWRRSVVSVVASDAAANRFLWREGSPADYRRLVGNVVAPPHWSVRFARFDGDVARRESWRVTVVDGQKIGDGTVRSIDHDIPEAVEGKRLTEDEARAIAETAIAERLRRTPGELRRVSADAADRPARLDWTFVYQDTTVAVPGNGEARIQVEIDGDQVASVERTLFVPEAKKRSERRRDDRRRIPRALFGVLLVAIVVAMIVVTVRRLARGAASLRAGVLIGGMVAVSIVASNVLQFDARQFSFTVAEPLDSQLFAIYLQWAGGAAIAGVFAGLLGAVGLRIASLERRARPLRERTSWAIALALALALTGSLRLITATTRAVAPSLPPVDTADSFSPLLSGFVSGLELPVVASLVLIWLTSLWPQRRALRALVVLTIAGLVATAIGGVADVRWDRVAALAGVLVVAVALYRVYVRGRLSTVVPFLAWVAILDAVPLLFTPAYPGHRAYVVAQLVAILGAAVLWERLATADRPSLTDARPHPAIDDQTGNTRQVVDA